MNRKYCIHTIHGTVSRLKLEKTLGVCEVCILGANRGEGFILQLVEGFL